MKTHHPHVGFAKSDDNDGRVNGKIPKGLEIEDTFIDDNGVEWMKISERYPTDEELESLRRQILGLDKESDK